MPDPWAGWTGEAALGEGITTAPLYARKLPDFAAPTVGLWQKGERLCCWHRYGDWLLVCGSDRTDYVAGWSNANYITLGV